MSDISDVLNVLAAQCAGYVYPNGTGQPSVTGNTVKTYPGWPTSSSLDQDLQREIVNVSIFPIGPERNVTRYAPQSHVMSIVEPTLTLTVSDNTITVGGAMPSPFTPHNMALLMSGKAFIYAIQATDTLTSIATGLASLISAAYPGTTSSGAVITLAAGANAQDARVGTTGTTAIEWERQTQRVQITVWAPDPTTRNQVSAAIKSSLSQISFLTMPDGFGARCLSTGQLPPLSDMLEKAKTYRRDLFYDIEYATTVEQQSATVVTLRSTYQPSPSGSGITIDI
jgi:hypothetical protein